MGARTAAREAALQMLYAAEFGAPEAERLIGDFWREFPGDAEGRSYADAAVRGVLRNRPRLDEQLTKASTNWRIERMNPIARNVLRLGTWELLEHPEIPRAVIIDESVEKVRKILDARKPALISLIKRLIEVESVDAEELRRIIDESTEGPLVVPGTFASPIRSPALEATEKIEVAGAE